MLKNPIYCAADKGSYFYFIGHGGNVFGDMIEFNGIHDLSVYNKTDQENYEDCYSPLFIVPNFRRTLESKPVSEFVIALGSAKVLF